MLRQLDQMLRLPQIQTIHRVQGAGDDIPILPSMRAFKRIQSAGERIARQKLV